MRPKCEIVARNILPKVRAELVKSLILTYNWQQVKVAEILGISQASVSHYLTDNRGHDDHLNNVFPDIGDYTDILAKDIVENNEKTDDLGKIFKADVLCNVCRTILTDSRFKEYVGLISEKNP